MSTAPLFENVDPGASSRAEQELAIDGILGVDPGLGGGLALLDLDGAVLGVWDTPSYQTGKGTQRDYDRAECWATLQTAAGLRPGLILVLEALHPMPKNGAIAAFKLGRALELWASMAVALGVRFEPMSSQRWQKTVGALSGEKGSLARARELFPREELKLVKHSGRAAALLIAESGRRVLIRNAQEKT